MALESFRDLRVWQAGMDLVEEIYCVTQQLPADEKFGLVSQMRRAAVPVPSNIAEGNVRKGTKEYLRQLSIAQASLAELQTQIESSAPRLHCKTRSRAVSPERERIGQTVVCAPQRHRPQH
jgi:four helix bundle protein